MALEFDAISGSFLTFLPIRDMTAWVTATSNQHNVSFYNQSWHSDSLLIHEHLLSNVGTQFSHDLERMSPYLFYYFHFGFLSHMKHEADGHSYINHRNTNFFSKM